MMSLCISVRHSVQMCRTVLTAVHSLRRVSVKILKPLSPMPNAYILLVKPPINVPTALIYEQIDNAPIEIRPDTDGMIDSLNNNDLYGVADRLCNVMENVTAKMYPIVGGIKTKMIMNGAVNAVMSGSGPTVFGIFDDFEKAKKIR